MTRPLPVLFFLALFSLAAPRIIRAEAGAMRAPFGLEWGHSRNRIEQLLAGAKATIVERRVLNGRDMWLVEGLVQPHLRRTVFYFQGGGLVEVELQYQDPKWTAADYSRFLGEMRAKVESRFGQGELIARSKTPVAEVVQTLVGYRWNQRGTEMEVIYFGAENGSQVYRTVSLHYKATGR